MQSARLRARGADTLSWRVPLGTEWRRSDEATPVDLIARARLQSFSLTNPPFAFHGTLDSLPCIGLCQHRNRSHFDTKSPTLG